MESNEFKILIKEELLTMTDEELKQYRENFKDIITKRTANYKEETDKLLDAIHRSFVDK